jgi:hypothetical protein
VDVDVVYQPFAENVVPKTIKETVKGLKDLRVQQNNYFKIKDLPDYQELS